MLTARQVAVASVQLREFLLKAAGCKGSGIGTEINLDGLQRSAAFDEGTGKEEPPHQLTNDQV